MPKFIRKLSFVVLVCSLFNIISSRENSDFYKGIGEKYDYNKDVVVSKPNVTNISITLPPVNKHEIDRFSKKQYEIVNVIWRKTKIFLDIDTTTTSKEISTMNGPLTPNPQPSNKLVPNIISTPSCIEFYYSDILDDQMLSKDNLSPIKKEVAETKIKHKLRGDFVDPSKAKVLRRPIFTFHLNNRNLKENDVNSENFYLDVNDHKHFQSNESNQLYNLMKISEKISNKRIARNNNNDSQWLSILFNDPLYSLDSPTKEETASKSTTFYDRIRFFEIHDNNTSATTNSGGKDEIETKINVTIPTEFVNTTVSNKTSNSYSIKRYAPRSLYNSDFYIQAPITNANKKRNIVDGVKENVKTPLSTTKPANEMAHRSIRTGTPMVWSKYPFLAVYIYEPMSIFCDAAAINSYWLIAAGSCLSRRRKSNIVNGRSAYISYCGDKWWEFNSITYVRRTIVHPLYNRHDKVRRHHYNIGAVQVITSMINSCPGWVPISLVSHNFTINEKGFPATAIGWGLDRYKSRYSYFNLPRRPLIAYEGTIFAKSCHTKVNANNELQYGKELNIKNLYCLSLPYRGDKKDTVHGSLLLVQGKLIALALQKGKNQDNEISVLYTGVWRLVPWILNITRNTTKQLLTFKNIS